MTKMNTMEELLRFFKTFADANRLKIVALLSKEELSVEQMAEMLGLNSSTVSHHLSKLSKLGLVSARAEGYYSVYRLEEKALSEMAQRLLADDTLPSIIEDVDLDAYDRKVLQSYLSADGKISAFPAQRKKEEAIIRYISHSFEVNQHYSEKEVNSILSQYSDDTARLRRHLVDFGFMQRQGGGGSYWRVANQ